MNRRIRIYRAHFSALIPQDIWNAIRTLTPPDENMSKAADARQEIDLRIGCAYTRFQTMLLRDSLPESESIVSYGPCQFPTLGFVVERYLQRHVALSLPLFPEFRSRTLLEHRRLRAFLCLPDAGETPLVAQPSLRQAGDDDTVFADRRPFLGNGDRVGLLLPSDAACPNVCATS